MTSPAFARQLTITASTKRPPAVSGGKRGAMVANLASVQIAPLTGVSSEVALRAGLDSPYNLLQTFADDVDIADGDELTPAEGVYANVAMPVRRAMKLPWGVRGETIRLHILLENLRR